MTDYAPGTKVVIIQDCRKGGIATGQTGTYEGRFNVEGSGIANPRIRLQDGSVIWGYECWWNPVSTSGPLPQMQEELEAHKAWLRDVFAAGLEEEVQDAS